MLGLNHDLQCDVGDEVQGDNYESILQKNVQESRLYFFLCDTKQPCNERANMFLDQNPEEPPMAYISFSSAKDSEWSKKHPNQSTIQVLGIASYDWFKKWEDSKWMKRGDDYEEFKEKLKESFLEKLYETVPQTKGHVEICEISTPLSTKHFANYSRGEIYGLEHTPKRFRAKFLRTKTHIKNFYLTGQDVVSTPLVRFSIYLLGYTNMRDAVPRVSIAMPVHNGEGCIESAIESILAQTYSDFELIVSDNASTDRTEDMCRSFAATDDRIRYQRNPGNLGAAANYNLTLEQARGEYFNYTPYGHDLLFIPPGA